MSTPRPSESRSERERTTYSMRDFLFALLFFTLALLFSFAMPLDPFVTGSSADPKLPAHCAEIARCFGCYNKFFS